MVFIRQYKKALSLQVLFYSSGQHKTTPNMSYGQLIHFAGVKKSSQISSKGQIFVQTSGITCVLGILYRDCYVIHERFC